LIFLLDPSEVKPGRDCFCGSPKTFSSCCQPFINKQTIPSTAEQLMRSRYTAFVIEDEAYLLASWHPEHRPKELNFDPMTKWLGLKVISAKKDDSNVQAAQVKFVARYKIAGKAYRIEEDSYFIKQGPHWLYCYAMADKG